jgi:hypothetical protein
LQKEAAVVAYVVCDVDTTRWLAFVHSFAVIVESSIAALSKLNHLSPIDGVVVVVVPDAAAFETAVALVDARLRATAREAFLGKLRHVPLLLLSVMRHRTKTGEWWAEEDHEHEEWQEQVGGSDSASGLMEPLLPFSFSFVAVTAVQILLLRYLRLAAARTL